MQALEALSADIIEDDFLNAYKPVMYMQTLISSVRVNIRDKFVFSPTKYQKIYTLIYLSITISCVVIYTIIKGNENHFYNTTQYDYSKYKFYTAVVMNITIVVVNTFCYNQENRKLIILLQTTYRNMKTLRNLTKRSYRNIKLKCALLLIIVIISSYIAYIFILITVPANSFWLHIIFMICFSAEDWEAIFLFGLLIFLTTAVKYVNAALQTLSRAPLSEDAHTLRTLCSTYDTIAQAMHIITKVFNYYIALTTLRAFIITLLVMKILLLQGLEFNIYVYVNRNLTLVKIYIRIILLGIITSYQEVEIARTDLNCVRALRNSVRGADHRYIKNLLRLLRVEVTPLHMLWICPVHRVPLQFVSVTVTYAVMLLQLAL